MASILLNILKKNAFHNVRIINRLYTIPAQLNENKFLKVEKIKDDKSFLRMKNDPEIFGNLSPIVPNLQEVDEGDIEEERYVQNPPSRSQKLSTKEYADIIKEHFKNKRVKEAIDVVEVRMKEDRVKPVNYIFNLLIGGCARAGYTKKSFQLYNKMKQHGLKVTGGTYTSLFNACANTPWLGDGINKANYLREVMIEKGYEPNVSNYNAMIKAYGRCGDVKAAFQLVDEMIEKDLAVTVDTFNFVLQACISDKDHGFRHALLVWHKMYKKQIVPDIYSFNLLLRSVRDCSLGDLETTGQVIEQILIQNNTKKPLKIGEAEKENESQLQISENVDAIPNLLSKNPHLGSLVSLGEVKKAEDRLLLLGGSTGFLNEMEINKVAPDIKTFTELLEVIPSTVAAEKQILQMIRKMGVKCDIDFFNILIKKRSMRFDYESAKQVLSMIKTAKLEPDIITYGVMSLGCTNEEEAHSLLNEMEEKGVRMNIQILGSMLRQGCSKRNFNYILEILDIVKNERIKPNEKFITNLHEFDTSCRIIVESKFHPVLKDKNFRKDYQKFKQSLESWREYMGIRNMKLEEVVKEVREHPWEQFKTPQADGFEAVKNFKLRHQKKTKRYIRKIKIDQIVE